MSDLTYPRTGGGWLAVFFGLSACSWVFHFACHYYRLETKSGFAVGDWMLSRTESVAMLGLYGGLVLVNLAGIQWVPLRFLAALSTGLGQLCLGLLHFYRLRHPFRFEVFGYPWPLAASLREAVVLTAFGIVCLAVAARVAAARPGSSR